MTEAGGLGRAGAFGPGEEIGHEARIVVGLDRRPDARHERLVVVQVVPGVQPRGEDLATAVQMMQIRPAVTPARRTAAGRIQRRRGTAADL